VRSEQYTTLLGEMFVFTLSLPSCSKLVNVCDCAASKNH
jgi:hypothetical protein